MNFTSETTSVVIGGTSGIGKAVADRLRQRPGRVEAAGLRTGIDVTDEAQLSQFLQGIGPFDHLVVTSGSQAPGGNVRDVSQDAARAAFDVKFWGTIAAVRAAAGLIRPGGSITLTSGFVARRTIPGTFVKASMNAALEAVTRILARELSPIRVNIVSPGLTDTEAHARMPDDARRGMLQRAAASLPAGTYGRPDDIAAAYLFAIDNPFATGSVIDVEGGALIA